MTRHGRPGRWAGELLSRPLAQPDERSCGAVVLVVAEALANERYARRLVAGGRARFVDEVLAMHRRATSAVDAAGRVQPPWPRLLGTPPWAVARQLAARTGVPHRVRLLRVPGPVGRRTRRRALAAVRDALGAGHAVPLYVGSATLPRHVVLALPDEPTEGAERDTLTVHDPAPGRPRRLRGAELVAGELTWSGWPVPWFAVLPDLGVTRPPARRTPA